MEHFILSVEDNPDDILLLGMAFRKAKFSARVDFITDGEKAIDYFASAQTKPLPLLMLLDLKLPKKSGLEVLAWVRDQQALRRLPIIMLTSSNQPEDIQQAYDLGANSYLVKPGNIEELVLLAQAIDTYWIRANARPNLDKLSSEPSVSCPSPKVIHPALAVKRSSDQLLRAAPTP